MLKGRRESKLEKLWGKRGEACWSGRGKDLWVGSERSRLEG